MSEIIVTKFIGFIGVLIANLRLIYFIQLKEYRFDRFYDFIKYDKGIRTLFKPLYVAAYLSLVLSIIRPDFTLFAVIFFVLAQLVAGFIYGFFRFKPTVKALVIFIFSLAIFFLVSLKFNNLYALILNPLVILICVIFANIVFNFQKNRIIKKAAHKISTYPNLKIVGVTGSYGKSSVKDFISEILQLKFKVIKTPENINSDIGIAQFILKTNFSDTDFFVVEMGAYRISEIAKICKITPPDYSFLTAIGEEHVSLFGSIKNIQKAKSEIFTNAKPNAKFFTNSDNQGCLEILKELNFSAIKYGATNEADFKCENLQIEQTGYVSFEYQGQAVKTSVTGKHQAINLMAAIAIGIELKIELAKILQKIPKIKTRTQTLTLKKGLNGCQVLDDSYNSNPAGFLSAIETCTSLKAKRKILLTIGMMELGDLQTESHLLVAKQALKTFDHIIILRKEIFEFFTQKSTLLEEPKLIIEYLKTLNLTDSDLVLLQNRIPKPVYDFILQK